MTQRIKFIDIAKAIAIIIIVIGHTLVHSEHCHQVFRFLYSFNVALFFILSGYTFNVKTKFSVFIKKKFTRIMIPYFIWAFIFIIPFILFGKNAGTAIGTNGTDSILNIIKNTLYGSGINDAIKQNTSLWFLPALFSMECVYYFIIKLFNNKHDVLKLIILLIIGFISSTYFTIVLPWGLNSVIQIGCGTFYVGYLLSKYKLFDVILKPVFVIFFLIIGIVINIIRTYKISYVNYEYGNYFLTLLIGISISLAIIYLSYLIRENRILEYIGKNTMGILIFHKIIVLVFQTKLGIVSKLLNNSNLFIELALTCVIVILSIIFSILITIILRKIVPFTIGEIKNKNNNA